MPCSNPPTESAPASDIEKELIAVALDELDGRMANVNALMWVRSHDSKGYSRHSDAVTVLNAP